MKKVFNNNRLIIVAFFTVFSVAASPAVMAHNNSQDLPVELKLIGTIKDQPLFQLSFGSNSMENEYNITIRDEAGNSLYSENIKGENFHKKFLLNNEDGEGEALRFEITSKKTNKTVVFEVNRQSHIVEEMVVSKTE